MFISTSPSPPLRLSVLVPPFPLPLPLPLTLLPLPSPSVSPDQHRRASAFRLDSSFCAACIRCINSTRSPAATVSAAPAPTVFSKIASTLIAHRKAPPSWFFASSAAPSPAVAQGGGGGVRITHSITPGTLSIRLQL